MNGDTYTVTLTEEELIDIAEDISKLPVNRCNDATKEFYKKCLDIIFDR